MLVGIYVLSEYVNTQIFMHAYILTGVFPPISRRGGHFPPLTIHSGGLFMLIYIYLTC